MTYKRKAHYHETDQMGIIHHSNYIKWLEEARIEAMTQAGLSYKLMEEEGILSPVLNVNIDYKAMVTFDDTIYIHTEIVSYNGIRFEVSYTITNEEQSIVYSTATSKHCFIDKEKMRVVSLKKKHVTMHELFQQMMNTDETSIASS